MDKRKHIIEVLPYDANWVKQFEAEAARIQPIFAENFVAVHHVGSTAIPGMSAKPTIDMILEVRDITLVDNCNNKMAKLGYEAWGEYGIAGRRFFVKGVDKRTHHIHTFQTNNFDITRHLYLRDYLIAHSLDAKAYADLKINLAQKFVNNRRAYLENKKEYVKALEEKAIAWATKRG